MGLTKLGINCIIRKGDEERRWICMYNEEIKQAYIMLLPNQTAVSESAESIEGVYPDYFSF